MNNNASHYFQASEDYFWQWEDNGEVIAIPNGETIAYKAYILEILEYLAPQGIPRFGALLLALIATNNNAHLESITQNLSKNGAHMKIVEQALEFLKILSSLPPEYYKGQKKLILLQTIFKDAHNNLSQKQAEKILRIYKALDRPITPDEQKKISPSIDIIYHDFRVIAILSSKFKTVQDILDAVDAIPTLEETIEIPLETSEKKDFISLLIEDEKTFYVGSLVKHIWSGLHIPLQNKLPSQQPLGGFSDLTNKGSFDKLLTSEFAYEETLFLSRIANQEALYILREIPPQSNDKQRVILIDVSLKNWGTPHVLAFAITLALIHHPKNKMDTFVYGVGQKYFPLKFDSKEDVIEGLNYLDACLHAGSGIELLFKENPLLKNAELFLIASDETYQTPYIQKIIQEHHHFFNYWIHTNIDGNISVYKKQNRGKIFIQNIFLQLKSIWKTDKKNIHFDSPQKKYYQISSSYPILFPNNELKAKILLKDSIGRIFRITKDKKLFLLNAPDKGWLLIYDHLPFYDGKNCIGFTEKSECILLMFNIHERAVYIIDINTDQQTVLNFPNYNYHLDFFFDDTNYQFICTNYSYQWIIKQKDEVWIIEQFQKSYEELNSLRNFYLQKAENNMDITESKKSMNVLKNIDTIFINEYNSLIFSKHELCINQDGWKLNPSQHLKPKIISKRTNINFFRFGDGSKITINTGGMLTFESSNPNIPVFHCPSVLEQPLAFASETFFIGNPYYKINHLQQKLITQQELASYLIGFIENIKNYGT
ncbi:hypothetical protein AD998_12065 [bacterium 336/3]|nr:hypothetical protein AD998_12065 [bacterium 336/3]